MKSKIVTWVTLSCLIIMSAIGISVYASNNSIDTSAELAQVSDEPEISKAREEALKYEEVPPIDVKDDEVVAQGDKREMLNENPKPVFEENKDLKDFYDIELDIDKKELDNVGAKVLSKRVMAYKDYVSESNNEKLTAIDDNRMVWVVSVYYPNGFQTKRGLYKNATVTGIYDAETGYYHGFDLVGDADDIIVPNDRK